MAETVTLLDRDTVIRIREAIADKRAAILINGVLRTIVRYSIASGAWKTSDGVRGGDLPFDKVILMPKPINPAGVPGA